ncbi:MAG: peptide chain release factor N(5)-glutamine methyltransferase [Actinomycetota bacterium]|nr:peptide chain release factor N(5)-glutamine methyltransferase [Actinomycetota bacterium]
MTAATDAVTAAAARLAAADVTSPRHDAEVLAAHVLGIRRAALCTAQGWDTARAQAFDDLIAERARRVPLQHLTGVAGFRYLDLAVGPGVFVPRPETEALVSWGLSQLAGVHAPVVVDLCAGSGAIGLSVALELPAATVYAVEREALALAWLHRNAEGTVVQVVAGDATDPNLLAGLDGDVDLVLSNPPYIPVGSVVEPEVAEHDPPAALWGGADGLQVLRRVAARAQALLRPGGQLGVEHGDRQGQAVPALLAAAGGWEDVADHPDLTGRDRFTTARRAAG